MSGVKALAVIATAVQNISLLAVQQFFDIAGGHIFHIQTHFITQGGDVPKNIAQFFFEGLPGVFIDYIIFVSNDFFDLFGHLGRGIR